MALRDIEADYRAAHIEEYRALLRAGRDAEAAAVAAVLRDRYGHEVNPAPEKVDHKAPENTAEQKPKRRGRPPRPKDADGDPKADA